MLTRPVLLFDGDCAFCQRWVDRLRRADRAARIELLPMQQRGSRPDLPVIADEALERAMHLVTPDGAIYRGGRAVPQLVEYLPRWRWTRLFWRLPFFPSVADTGYLWVAARRHRLGCGNDSCHWQGGDAGHSARLPRQPDRR